MAGKKNLLRNRQASAIGDSIKELFNLDSEYDQFIVFKHEGITPENIYHGYHVPKDSRHVPQKIREELINLKPTGKSDMI